MYQVVVCGWLKQKFNFKPSALKAAGEIFGILEKWSLVYMSWSVTGGDHKERSDCMF